MPRLSVRLVATNPVEIVAWVTIAGSVDESPRLTGYLRSTNTGIKSFYLGRQRYKNLSSPSVVSLGCSSRIQCPAFFNTMTVTFVATNFICCPSTSPSDLSPPMDNTGIVNFVCDSCTKSLAVWGNELKYAQPAFMRPGRAYAAA